MSVTYEEARCRTELRRVYRELHYERCGDQGYYAPITECPHLTCVRARQFLSLPAGKIDTAMVSRARPDDLVRAGLASQHSGGQETP